MFFFQNYKINLLNQNFLIKALLAKQVHKHLFFEPSLISHNLGSIKEKNSFWDHFRPADHVWLPEAMSYPIDYHPLLIFQWIFPWNTYEIPWISYKIPWNSYNITWHSIKRHEIPIEFFTYKIQWNSIKSHEIPIKSFKIPITSFEIPLNPMKFHENVMKLL